MPKKLNPGRLFRDSRGPRPDGYSIRQEQAKQIAENWSKLTPEQKLKALDTRLGVGVGAQRQRQKLLKELSDV